ncbi:MAG: MATE family efflux transporter, partial [Enterocloster clostridioformis]|uniref:MATE family efflux transporter n=1 Tax=Enterocloster clostridioformis TaxID=1531 RepID=UPI00242EAB1A
FPSVMTTLCTGCFSLLAIIIGLLMIIDFIIEDLMLNSYLQKNFHTLACGYMKIICCGTVFVFGYNAVCSVLKGLGDSKSSLCFVGIATIINIVLDIILVGPFGMGTAGTAYATITAQGLSFAISLFYLKRHRIFFSAENHSKFTLQWDKLAAIVKVGLPTTIQMAVVNTAYLLVAGMLNQFGTAVSAASNVGLQINTFAAMPCWAIGQAVTAMAGQCMGAGQIGRARKVVKISLVMNVAVTLVAVIGVQLFAEPLILLFGSTPETVNNGVYYLRICCSVNSLIYAAMYTLDSFAIGVGAANVAMINALLDAVIVRLPVSWLLAFALYMGFPGIYYGQAISPVLPAIVGLLYFVSKKWEHKTLIQTDHKGRSL